MSFIRIEYDSIALAFVDSAKFDGATVGELHLTR